MRRLMVMLIMIFLTVISINTYSQNKDTSCFKGVVVTTTLSDYFPEILYHTVNLNMGAEIYLKNRKSLWFNLGLIKSYKIWELLDYVSLSNSMGFKAQGECRYYLNKHKVFEPATLLFWPHIFQFDSQNVENSGYYVAVHSSFQNIIFERFEYSFAPVPVPVPVLVSKNVLTLNMKIGYQCIKKSNFTIDFVIGFGGRYIYGNQNDTYYRSHEKSFWSMLIEPPDGFSPNAVCQFRLGWSF